jgi:hypothetical protein
LAVGSDVEKAINAARQDKRSHKRDISLAPKAKEGLIN